MKTQGNMRELLARIGIGQFTATMIIQSMFMAPATTDPKSPPIIMLVTHIQRAINKMGWPLRISGYLDVQTANALTEIVGQGWESRSWGDNVSAIVNTTVRYKMDAPSRSEMPKVSSMRADLGFYDPPFLPSIPGGIVTYAALGAVAYHFWTKRK